MPCKKDPCGDHHNHKAHTKGRKFSYRAMGICDPDLADVVDTVEMPLEQMQECITSTFTEEAGDPRHSMRRYAVLKNQSHRALVDFLQSPGTAAMGDRPRGCYPATSWAVNWPLDKRSRGDMSNLVGHFRHFYSCSHYLRGSCWIPFAISQRLIHTGHLLIASTLADKRFRQVPTCPRFSRSRGHSTGSRERADGDDA